jgi:aminopeptidase N
MTEDRGDVIQYSKRRMAPIVDTTVTNLNALLNTNSYQKGGWVLHMLRQEVGEEAFWKGIRAYYQKYKDANALTADFQQVMENVAGKSLQTFFAQWVFRAGHPELKIDWKYDTAKKQVEISVQQLQGAPFVFPLELQFLDENKKITLEKTLQVAKTQEVFRFSLPNAPKDIKIDPQARLLYEPR